MVVTAMELQQVINKLFDTEWDPGLSECLEHFHALNRIMSACGSPIEGSLFTPHLPSNLPDVPDPQSFSKRRNFALFCTGGSSLCEIGFNAGHSCMLALTVNRYMSYVGIDLAAHPYTIPCYDYLRSVFGDRVRLHFGDSREVMPAISAALSSYDLFHLDGGHGFEIAHADICNILNCSRTGATLLVDDTGHPDIDAMCDFYVMSGRLIRIEMKRLWSDTINHRLFTVTNPHGR